ncbi:hypothetical protein CXB51_008485 [Gossypium anomalum]|uniref:Uncharacterized protein n=1 Tax=Gossypium anomalum TaxID=47600 RepID=A0A8J6D691_9ROSI|nr:hypothetical protein CXB51_008485 [Gossypium anomalum]
MGGCATKPKVLKGDEPEIPAPAPSKEAVPEPKEAALAVAADGEKKVEADEVAKDKDVIDDDAIDDQSNKRRSLSNLFQEKEKGTAESDTTPSEPVKNETSEPALQESPETAKQESLEPVEHRISSSSARGSSNTAAAAAVVNVPETQSKETSAGEKKDEMLFMQQNPVLRVLMFGFHKFACNCLYENAGVHFFVEIFFAIACSGY